jgi:hypothetical protein
LVIFSVDAPEARPPSITSRSDGEPSPPSCVLSASVPFWPT